MTVQTDPCGDKRFYVNSGTKITVPGVTTILDVLAKPGIKRWEARAAAELAVDSLDFIARMNETAGREATVKHLAAASKRRMTDAQNRGNELHDIAERKFRGAAVRVPPNLRASAAHFDDFLRSVQPELVAAEEMVWSDTHAYAGSFDWAGRIKLDENGKLDVANGQPTLLLGDTKTGGKIWPSVAMQLAAYAHADRMVDAEGNSKPNLPFAGGAVLHVTDDGWTLYPVRIDREVLDMFLHLRAAFDWEKGLAKDVLGIPLASSAELTTGTERRSR